MFVGAPRRSQVEQRSAFFVDPITIGFDRLQLLVQAFAKRIEDRLFWLTPMAIAITLLATIIVSDFKDKYGLKAIEWRDGTIIALVCFAVWTVAAGIRAARRPRISELMDSIAKESTSPLRTYALTYFRAKDVSGSIRVLVYYDQIWQCYLVPFVSLQPGQTDPLDVSEYATQRFSLPKEAFVAQELAGHDLRQSKTSEASHRLTNYHFHFFFIKVTAKYYTVFLKQEFEVQERVYRWLTIEELLSDTASMQRNGEVFRYMRDERSAFFQDGLPLSLNEVVGR